MPQKGWQKRMIEKSFEDHEKRVIFISSLPTLSLNKYLLILKDGRNETHR